MQDKKTTYFYYIITGNFKRNRKGQILEKYKGVKNGQNET